MVQWLETSNGSSLIEFMRVGPLCKSYLSTTMALLFITMVVVKEEEEAKSCWVTRF